MAKEFGSKAEMLSSKLDEVARNSIWREHCHKEVSGLTLNENFSVSNPNLISVFAEKPNYVNPHTISDKVALVEAQSTLKDLCVIKERSKEEKRSRLPRTGAEEIGWAQLEFNEENELFTHKRTACEITKYADAYYDMSGTTPFSRKAEISANPKA